MSSVIFYGWLALLCLFLVILFKRKSFLVFLALLATTPFYIYKIPTYFWYLQKLPSTIKVNYPVAMGTEGDLADGCDVTVFKLSESTIKNIRTQGIRFFDGAAIKDKYGQHNIWKETPSLPMWKINRGEDSPVRCDVISDRLLNQITEAVMKKGSYHTKNSEIELMIIPTLGFAVIVDAY